MADAVDYANEVAENEIAWAVRSHLMAQKQLPIHKNCVECGEDLPEIRQQMRVKHCIDCATDLEKKRAQYAD